MLSEVPHFRLVFAVAFEILPHCFYLASFRSIAAENFRSVSVGIVPHNFATMYAELFVNLPKDYAAVNAADTIIPQYVV